MEDFDFDMGATEIDFDPTLNDINQRRMDLMKLRVFLESDTDMNTDLREFSVDNVVAELNYIVQELEQGYKEMQDSGANGEG